MSRIQKKNHKFEIAFGRDHVLGLFVQLFPRSLVTSDPLLDKHHLALEQLLSIVKRCGFTVSDYELKMLE